LRVNVERGICSASDCDEMMTNSSRVRAPRQRIIRVTEFALRLGLIMLVCVPAPASAAQSPSQKAAAFTVANSIELNVVVPFQSVAASTSSAATTLCSPNGTKCLLRMRRGDLRKNVVVESLLMFDALRVGQYLNGKAAAPRPDPLLELEISRDSASMDAVQWLSDLEVGFIAAGPGGTRQAFAVDVATKRRSQLTTSRTDVASFAVAGEVVLYYAHLSARPPVIGAITDKGILDTVFPEEPTETPVEMYQASRATQENRRIAIPAAHLGPNFRRIWLAPSAAFAVSFTPAVNAPPYWADYRVGYYDLFGYVPDRNVADPQSPELQLKTRYQLIDLSKNEARPLLDAPSGFLSFNGSPAEVYWLPDERSVIVSNTYVPLGAAKGRVRERHMTRPAIVEVDLLSGKYSVIAWEPGPRDHTVRPTSAQETFVSVAWRAPARCLGIRIRDPGGNTAVSHYCRNGNRWTEHATNAAQADTNELQLSVKQALRERPRVFASSNSCGCAMLLYDPNPDADSFAFGAADVVRWTDANRIEWRGGLILPPDYRADRHYPLVVQTHGFNPAEFLIDGPGGITSAMAAQPLANAGLVVLQVEDNARAMTLDEHEGPLFAEGLRAGIEDLVARGLVDRKRVGLIAFSRTGYHALHLLAASPDLLAAVTISDALQQGYFADLLLANGSREATDQVRRLSGGGALSREIRNWLAANPIYKLRSARAAVRLEANGPSSVLGLWESFAILRESGRAVDFMYFPEGSHVLMKPAERLASQGGNVDWFRFWLLDQEDPDPGKAQQYARWRKLRGRE
jgi:hypothetical protein